MKSKPLKKSEPKKKSEKQVVASCRAYLKRQGWITKLLYTGGIPIGFGKLAANPAKGIPDCLAFNESLKFLLWIEYKKSYGGKVSPEQLEFHQLLKTCGQYVIVVNSLDSLKGQLDDIHKERLIKELGFRPDYLE